jgi:hypothetical protein
VGGGAGRGRAPPRAGHRLPDHRRAARGARARHRHRGALVRVPRAVGGEDRDHQRRDGHLVRRLHAGGRGRGLDRVRPAPAHHERGHGRASRRAGVGPDDDALLLRPHDAPRLAASLRRVPGRGGPGQRSDPRRRLPAPDRARIPRVLRARDDAAEHLPLARHTHRDDGGPGASVARRRGGDRAHHRAAAGAPRGAAAPGGRRERGRGRRDAGNGRRAGARSSPTAEPAPAPTDSASPAPADRPSPVPSPTPEPPAEAPAAPAPTPTPTPPPQF